MSKKNEKDKYDIDISATSFDGFPITSFDLINKYGTYEIQPTCDMQAEFPVIAQGLAKNYNKPTTKSKVNDYGKDNKPY